MKRLSEESLFQIGTSVLAVSMLALMVATKEPERSFFAILLVILWFLLLACARLCVAHLASSWSPSWSNRLGLGVAYPRPGVALIGLLAIMAALAVWVEPWTSSVAGTLTAVYRHRHGTFDDVWVEQTTARILNTIGAIPDDAIESPTIKGQAIRIDEDPRPAVRWSDWLYDHGVQATNQNQVQSVLFERSESKSVRVVVFNLEESRITGAFVVDSRGLARTSGVPGFGAGAARLRAEERAGRAFANSSRISDQMRDWYNSLRTVK